MKIKIIFLWVWCLMPLLVSAQNLTLDATFSEDDSLPGRRFLVNLKGNLGAMSVDKVGRIVTASYNPTDKTLHIMRVLPSGIIDSSFGLNGYKKITSSFNHTITSIAIQADNKIILGGSKTKTSVSTVTDMFLLRLNENGSEDTNVLGSGFWTWDFGGNDLVQKIYIQNDGKIIIAGRDTTGIRVARLNNNCSFDVSFGSGKGYLGFGSSLQSVGGVAMDDANNILIAGDSLGYFRVIKLLSSGDKFINFGNKGIATILLYTGPPVGIVRQSNGKIILAGSYSPYQFTAVRFTEDGKVDTAYGNNYNGIASYSCYYSNMRNLLIQRDGKVLMGGLYSGNEYRLMKLNTSGILDSTFGVSGQAPYSGAPSAVQYFMSPDGRVFMYGKQSGGFYLYKVLTNPFMNILGNSYTFPRSVESFKIKAPSTYPVTTVYNWYYSGSGALFVGGSTGTNVTMIFSENATSGKLRCIARSGSTILGFEEMDVLININASAARQLAPLVCTPGVSNCSGSYIDLFQLNKTKNVTQGCSNNGYTDFTPSNYTDTLYIGGVYSAKLKLGGDGIRNVSMWIDYNNDGFFNSSDEFLGESSSDNSIVDLNNIVFKNAEGYEGPKRLRVRCKGQSRFNPDEACPTNGDIGETEDYLVVIQRQSVLEAPQIITPNEDGKNDYFVIRGVDPSSSSKLIIFDRNGKVKFTKDNYENNWNGVTSDGEKLLPGTYYYVFTNKDESLKGFLEIRY